MENLTKEINAHFSNEYNFLKLWEVTYDKESAKCKIAFLYPQNVDITDEQKNKLEVFLYDFLKINAKLEVKFKKSYLDDELINNYIIEYFKRNNFSLFVSIKQENIAISKNLNDINVKFCFPKEIMEYISENNIFEKLKEDIEKNFIASFYFEMEKSQNEIDQSILVKRENEINVVNVKKVARYEVYDIKKIFGKDVTPYPELISEQKSEKTNVILAGEVGNIIKKQYKSKRSKTLDELNFFYTFDIKDATGTISAIHFSTKTNESKLDALTVGMHCLFLGDIRNNIYNKLTYFVNSVSHCIIVKDEILKVQEENKKEKFFFSDEYKTVKPQPYLDKHQENLFFKNEYTDLINNNTIVVFDVETTGLEPEFAEIIELGAVKVVNGELIETFQSLIKPENEIPSVITEITSITNDMVEDAPRVTQVLTDFILFSRDSVLSGYNVGFDMRFLQKFAQNMGFKFENRVEDAMSYARAQLSLGNYTLKNVAKNLDISLKEAHRALNDAIATARVLIELNKKKN